MSKLKIYILLITLFAIYSCDIANNSSKKDSYDWNYLVYMGADNNLERFAIDNLIDMQAVGSSSKVNVMVLVDRSPGYDKSHDNWSGTRLYRVTKKNESVFDQEIIIDYDELDMTNAENIKNFLLYSMTNYPSKKTSLVLWSHGTGIYPDGILFNETKKSTNRAVIHDYSTGYNSSDSVSVQSLETVFSEIYKVTGKKINILQFDSCLMQMNEIIWQLHDYVDYIVGAETDVPATGNNYISVLESFNVFSVNEEKELVNQLVEAFYNNYSSSLISTSYSAVYIGEGFTEYKNAFNYFIDELLNLSDNELKVIYNIRSQLYSYSETYTEYVDLYDFVNNVRLNSSFTNSEISKKANNVISELDKIILNSKVTNNYVGKLNGIGINFPKSQEILNLYSNSDNYNIIRFSQDTKWSNFLIKIANLVH